MGARIRAPGPCADGRTDRGACNRSRSCSAIALAVHDSAQSWSWYGAPYHGGAPWSTTRAVGCACTCMVSARPCTISSRLFEVVRVSDPQVFPAVFKGGFLWRILLFGFFFFVDVVHVSYRQVYPAVPHAVHTHRCRSCDCGRSGIRFCNLRGQRVVTETV